MPSITGADPPPLLKQEFFKLWVTGANGLVGSALREHATFATGHREVDITDLAQLRLFVKEHPGVTHIVNCAAIAGVDFSETHREEAFQVNAVGPENLGILSREIGTHLVHLSTDYVYPGSVHRPLKETDPVSPCNYYGETKLEGERRLQRVNPSALILRTSWVFGSGGTNFVAKLLQMLQQQEEILLTNDHWSRPTYVVDLVAAILHMRDEKGIYNFANQGVASKYEFALTMREEALAQGIPVVTKRIVPMPGSHFPSPCQRPVYSAFDTEKIEQKLFIRSWQEALREFLCVP
ncbi:MAG: dTDP-4-dehydrorhamnose reductase [Chlamydiia bacterium]|nr:dTDP-4-dehydrorhamnose reductase [Chlamydiia bacterium]